MNIYDFEPPLPHCFIERKAMSQFNADGMMLYAGPDPMRETIREMLEPTLGQEAWFIPSFYIRWGLSDDHDKIIVEAWGYYDVFPFKDIDIFRIL